MARAGHETSDFPLILSLFRFLEEAYVARDPFSSVPKPLLLGSHCTACNKAVCVSQVRNRLICYTHTHTQVLLQQLAY